MTDDYLERIVVRFPHANSDFALSLRSLVDVLGRDEGRLFRLTGSSQRFFPRLFVDFESRYPEVVADFVLSNSQAIPLKVENSTGISRQSPHAYRAMSVGAVSRRLATAEVNLTGIDHVGINLPWFSPNLHPEIVRLRAELSSRCLYHRYPTGEPWDFILPGTSDEIAHRIVIDYGKVRRPKFELVSFNQSSIPLVQFDISVSMGYDPLTQLFPESLNDPQLRKLWVYLQNPCGVDVCLAMNGSSEGDWSAFFGGFRL